MRIVPVGLAIALLAAGAAMPVRAADGALEISQDCAATGCFSGDASGFPVTISAPGRYLLTSNLTATSAGVTAIQISASPVDLDLGGFTIDGGSTCIGYPVGSCAGSTSQRGVVVTGSNRITRIRNGTVKGFDNGILLDSALDGTVLEDIVVSDSRSDGIVLDAPSATALLRRVVSSRNFNSGFISLQAGRVTVRDSVFSGNGTGANSGPTKAIFLDNQFLANFFFGVRCNAVGSVCVLGRNVFIENNSASSTDEYSITTTLRDMGGNVCEDGACP